ncbi:hypothetical protein CLI64_14155 [Nostoc sp. CENA543]|uniref:hypothetical protein n=1 Tax=Nostoc sp. CENA543 TaxID=1869241 RepID=UPI000CA1C289|nr:hypothetical protein [Nostoc sp. CENA543]AUT01441.1 hypothetical protein CLI64_14155 [Nostoc sp. CENA543]
MKTTLQSVIAGFLGVLCTVPISLIYNQAAQAQYNEDYPGDTVTRIILHNHSRRSSITGLYVWNRERQEWSRNRLDSPLEAGSDSRVLLSRRRDECNYRIKVIYSEGRDLESNDELTTRFNACEYRHLVVRRREIIAVRRNPDRN